jgi:hypothetical protein
MDKSNQSRFSTLRVFKLPGAPRPPPPPPKDTPYSSYLAAASTSQLTVNTTPAPVLPPSPVPGGPFFFPPPMHSPHSADARFPSEIPPSPARSPQSATAFKKGLFSAFARRPQRAATTSPAPIPHSPSLSALHDPHPAAEGISPPYNVQVSPPTRAACHPRAVLTPAPPSTTSM